MRWTVVKVVWSFQYSKWAVKHLKVITGKTVVYTLHVKHDLTYRRLSKLCNMDFGIWNHETNAVEYDKEWGTQKTERLTWADNK